MTHIRHAHLPVKRIKSLLLIVLLINLIGTLGYHYIMQINLLDSFYMTVITLATVGFGEVKPLTPAGRLFTICLILGGVGIITYTIESIIEITTAPDFSKYFIDMANARKVKKMENHYIICGLGRVGSRVSEEMDLERAPFVCIEKDPERAKSCRDKNWVVIEGDATEDLSLHKAGIDKAKGIICVMDSDVNNLYVTISARSIRNDIRIITRVVDDNSIPKFQKAGATQVISPYTILGQRIVRSVLRPGVDAIMDLALHRPEYDFHLTEIEMGANCGSICGKSIRDSHIKTKTGASIVSIIRKNKSICNNPDPEAVIEKGDILILIGTSEQLKKVREEFV